MTAANPHRGEASLVVAGETVVLRPSFSALVAAEQELGPLFALVERAAEGGLSLSEIAALFDHLSAGRPAAITRERIGDAVVATGLAKIAPALRLVAIGERFLLGRLRFLSGANCGVETIVVDVEGDTVRVRDLPRAGVQSGCAVELREGCDKRFATCVSRFDNAANFRGEPHLPGNDLLTRYPGS